LQLGHQTGRRHNSALVEFLQSRVAFHYERHCRGKISKADLPERIQKGTKAAKLGVKLDHTLRENALHQKD
jgi:hypothetical protein